MNKFIMFRVAFAGEMMENFLSGLIGNRMNMTGHGNFMSFAVYEFETEMDIQEVHDYFKSNHITNYVLNNAGHDTFRASVPKNMNTTGINLQKYDISIYDGSTVENLTKMMDEAVKKGKYEDAAKYRDAIQEKTKPKYGT